MLRAQRAWKRTDQLFALIKPEAIGKQPIAQRHKLVFYPGHLASFALSQRNKVLPPVTICDKWDKLFVRGIDPNVHTDECHDHSCPRDFKDWPSHEELREYVKEVRSVLAADCTKLHGSRIGRQVWAMIVEHEELHQETLMYMLQRLPLSDLNVPKLVAHPIHEPSPSGPEFIAFPYQRVTLGADPHGSFVWDNEVPRHRVNVAEFQIQQTPVSNTEYFDFLVKVNQLSPKSPLWPQQWTGNLKVRELLFEHCFSTRLSHPVLVTHRQARAYCDFFGGRLPTEAEWIACASMPDKPNIDFRHMETLSPLRDGALGKTGMRDSFGNVWKWTSCQFEPFKGYYNSHPTYPEFSYDFFTQTNPKAAPHYVLKGGSWATTPNVCRRSFRNFFQDDYPHVLSGFHMVLVRAPCPVQEFINAPLLNLLSNPREAAPAAPPVVMEKGFDYGRGWLASV